MAVLVALDGVEQVLLGGDIGLDAFEGDAFEVGCSSGGFGV